MDEPHAPKASTDAEQMSRLVEILVKELRQQPRPAPSPDPEIRAVKWVKGLMPTFIGIFGFGGQITFTVIPTIVKDEDVPSDWGADKVRLFLSLAWMFFTLGLGLSCAMALTQVYGGDAFTERLDAGRYEIIVNSLCAVLQLSAALAFLFLSLVVVAYTPAVGWFVFGTACLCVVLAVGTFIFDTWL